MHHHDCFGQASKHQQWTLFLATTTLLCHLWRPISLMIRATTTATIAMWTTRALQEMETEMMLAAEKATMTRSLGASGSCEGETYIAKLQGLKVIPMETMFHPTFASSST
jgi:hypothetical protein